jgi:hypothetical protein
MSPTSPPPESDACGLGAGRYGWMAWASWTSGGLEPDLAGPGQRDQVEAVAAERDVGDAAHLGDRWA